MRNDVSGVRAAPPALAAAGFGALLVAAVLLPSGVPRALAMSPPRPTLDLAPPAGGALAPNAAIVLHGWITDHMLAPVVTLKVPKKKPTRLAVVTERAPARGTGVFADAVFLVRPEHGDWPAGARLEIEAVFERGKPPAKYTLEVGTKRDETPPAAARLGPGRIEKYSPPMLAPRDALMLPYPAFADDAASAVVLAITLRDPRGGGRTTARFTLLVGSAGTLVLDPVFRACEGATLTDTAGNVRTIPPSDCTGA